VSDRRARAQGPAALAAVALIAAGCGGTGGIEHFTVDSRLVGRKLEQAAVVPPGGAKGRPILLLLHGRSSTPDSLVSAELRSGVDELGDRAPLVVLVNGGDHSYYHDRRDGRWGTYVLREVVPAAARKFGADPRRLAIGGFSMGGFGALDIARLAPGRFCAVGGHSAALWASGGETPQGAYDDADDFERHDVLGAARAKPRLYGRTRVWLDVGTSDPFLEADKALAATLRGETLKVRPGKHGTSYWWPHMREYLDFYALALADCRRAL
jgi:S-formylglutathione hydrolase FrmB